jgi:hypothetical protein
MEAIHRSKLLSMPMDYAGVYIDTIGPQCAHANVRRAAKVIRVWHRVAIATAGPDKRRQCKWLYESIKREFKQSKKERDRAVRLLMEHARMGRDEAKRHAYQINSFMRAIEVEWTAVVGADAIRQATEVAKQELAGVDAIGWVLP